MLGSIVDRLRDLHADLRAVPHGPAGAPRARVRARAPASAGSSSPPPPSRRRSRPSASGGCGPAFGVVRLLCGASVLFTIAFVAIGLAPTLPAAPGRRPALRLRRGRLHPDPAGRRGRRRPRPPSGAPSWRCGSAPPGPARRSGPLAAASAVYAAVGTVGHVRARRRASPPGSLPSRRSVASAPSAPVAPRADPATSVVAMGMLQVIGGGRMGEALVGGLLTAGGHRLDGIRVVEPDRARDARPWARRSPASTWSTSPAPAEGTVVAVKPADVAAACQALAAARSEPRAVDRRRRHASPPSRPPWRPGSRVVRAMPNTPALVGAGAAAIAGGHRRRRRRPGLGRGAPRRGRHRRAGAGAAARRGHRPVRLRARPTSSSWPRRSSRPACSPACPRDVSQALVRPDPARRGPAARRGRRRPRGAAGRGHLARRHDRRRARRRSSSDGLRAAFLDAVAAATAAVPGAGRVATRRLAAPSSHTSHRHVRFRHTFGEGCLPWQHHHRGRVCSRRPRSPTSCGSRP